MPATPDNEALLTPSEVAAMFRVNPKTVTRWARAGKISAIRTLGGHRRFRAAEIQTAGSVTDDEMEHVFNLGLGMLAVVAPGTQLHALDRIRAAGHDAWIVGELRAAHGLPRVTITR